MAKITKRAEMLNQLHELVKKEAELAQTNISGVPGKDTNVSAISEKTESTDKNNVGPEHLNNEQGYEQKPSTEPAEPVANAKTANDSISKLADDILGVIKDKMALAQTDISGVPCKDTNVSSVSEKTENTDKNNIGPEHLNKEQGYEQKPSSEPAEPVANAKSASYNLGVAFVEAISKRAQDISYARQKQAEAEMLKEAGRRDLETLIAYAAESLQTQEKQAAEAEAAGAAAFDALYKQAQMEAVVEENQKLKEKLASFEVVEQESLKKQAEANEEAKMAKLASTITDTLVKALKNAAPTNA